MAREMLGFVQVIEEVWHAPVRRAKAGEPPGDAEGLPDLLRFDEVAVLAALGGVVAFDLRADLHLLHDETNEVGDLLQLTLHVLLSASEEHSGNQQRSVSRKITCASVCRARRTVRSRCPIRL